MAGNSQILNAMRGFGRKLISETATLPDAERHVADMRKLGYSDNTHVHFSDFIHENRALKPRKDDTVRWVGEILVDYIFLEAARYLTNQETLDLCRRCNGCCIWPFTPPAIYLKQRPYTEAAFTFRNFGYPVGRLVFLADKREYDDIFDKILLWRTYHKEPFHFYQYGLHVRSVSAYHMCRAEVKKIEQEQRKIEKSLEKGRIAKQEWEATRKAWIQNTDRDRKTEKHKDTINHLARLPLAERLRAIAESEYAIDFYPKEWGVLATKEETVKDINHATKQKLLLKLEGKRYQGWRYIRDQLHDTGISCFGPIPSHSTVYVYRSRKFDPKQFVDPKLKVVGCRYFGKISF